MSHAPHNPGSVFPAAERPTHRMQVERVNAILAGDSQRLEEAGTVDRLRTIANSHLDEIAGISLHSASEHIDVDGPLGEDLTLELWRDTNINMEGKEIDWPMFQFVRREKTGTGGEIAVRSALIPLYASFDNEGAPVETEGLEFDDSVAVAIILNERKQAITDGIVPHWGSDLLHLESSRLTDEPQGEAAPTQNDDPAKRGLARRIGEMLQLRKKD
jgi:hypothetical protein